LKKNKTFFNQLFTDLFQDILKTEENCLKGTPHKHISIKEIHVIETVCNAYLSKGNNSTAALASDLKITAGSLSVSVSILEKKGYLFRETDKNDKRVVHILPTQKGLEVNNLHSKFHEELIDSTLNSLEEEELSVLEKTLKTLIRFSRKKKEIGRYLL
jgi:DNA-binding MarR family transcriptional regulator